MGFFRKMFGKVEATPPKASANTAQPAPPSGVRYNPKLIDTMLSEHARLSGIFGRIGTLAKADEFGEVRPLLTHFKSSFQAHILTENVQFYAYLEKTLTSDESDVSTIHDFRRDMNAIARKVVGFVKMWQTCDFATAAERQQFLDDYEKVGKLLEHRLDSEENSLYPLYQPF